MSISKKLSSVFKNSKDGKIYDFFSRFSKAIMSMLAILPAAGLLITIGKVIGPLGFGKIEGAQAANYVGAVIEQIGWLPFTHMGVLFAVGIGASWTKSKMGGAFSAVVAYFVLLAVTGTMYTVYKPAGVPEGHYWSFITKEFLTINGKPDGSVGGGFLASQEGVTAVNFGAFGGIISGFAGAIIFNKFHNFNKLPKPLAFFNGVRFVPIMVMVIYGTISVLLGLVWPFIQIGLKNVGLWMVRSQNTPFAIPFLYGAMERLLLPFGLHHMLTIPMNYTEAGGQYISLFSEYAGGKFNGNMAGMTESQAIANGQEFMWYTWVTDLAYAKNHTGLQITQQWYDANQAYADAHHISVGAQITPELIEDIFRPVRFKAGQMIGSTGSMVGASIGMLLALPKERRAKYKSMYISAALASALTGVTEPVEFLFAYTAPLLYVVHALLQGVAFGLTDFIPMRIHAFGGIETIIKYAGIAAPAGLGLDGLWFLLVTIGFGGIYFGIFYVMCRKFKFNIPGMTSDTLENTPKTIGNQKGVDGQPSALITKIIQELGGLQNLKVVDACMTRLRVTLRDPENFNEQGLKETGAVGVIKKGTGVQVVYGPQADQYKQEILQIIEDGIEIPGKTTKTDSKEAEKTTQLEKVDTDNSVAKEVVEKTVAKKTATKKPVAKKAATKKPTVKKPTAKKTAK